MCGIVGIISNNLRGETWTNHVAEAAATINHRGPNGSGVSSLAGGRIVLGHRRLSIIELSQLGHQPLTSRDQRIHVTYNGEIYNSRSLRRELSQSGVVFDGRSDTEVLAESIAARGLDQTLLAIEGMFAFAVADTSTRTITIARDRLGEKPLYWYFDGTTFAFASELRALRCLPGVSLTIDDSSAASILRWGFIPHPHSIYREVRQVPPGGLVTVDLSGDRPQVTERQWWSFSATATTSRRNSPPTSLDAASAEFTRLLFDSVEARLESDVPLGAFLSGGIDSSLVAAAAQSILGRTRLRTFTVSMPSVGLDEAEHAAAVASHLGTDHTTLTLATDDALRIITDLPTLWDEPFADPSMLPSALLCRAASAHVSVCLGGDGGDELFAGYNRHALGVTVNDVSARFPPRLRSLVARGALRLPGAMMDRVGMRLPRRSIPNLGDKVQKAAYLMLNVDPVWEQLASVWPTTALGVQPHHPDIGAPTDDMSSIERMLLADSCAVLPDQMLVKVDRASMASSLEVRSPLLDTRLVEWAWSLPMEFKAARGVGKIVMRHAAQDLLPAGIAARRKLGFDPPLARWLRTELRQWSADLLADPQVVRRGWLRPEALGHVVDQHLSVSRNWEYRLWSVLMLEAWLREHHP